MMYYLLIAHFLWERYLCFYYERRLKCMRKWSTKFCLFHRMTGFYSPMPLPKGTTVVEMEFPIDDYKPGLKCFPLMLFLLLDGPLMEGQYFHWAFWLLAPDAEIKSSHSLKTDLHPRTAFLAGKICVRGERSFAKINANSKIGLKNREKILRHCWIGGDCGKLDLITYSKILSTWESPGYHKNQLEWQFEKSSFPFPKEFLSPNLRTENWAWDCISRIRTLPPRQNSFFFPHH